MKFSVLTSVAPAVPSRCATYAPAKPPPRMSVPAAALRSAMPHVLRKLDEAPFEEAALCAVLAQRQRAFVLGARLVRASEAAQEVGARRVEVAVAVELEGVDEREAGLRAGSLRDCDRAVQLDHR